MQDNARDESVPQLIPKPGQVTRVIFAGSGRCFDLDGDHLRPAEFDDEVHFVSACLVTEMINSRKGLEGVDLGSQLRQNKVVEKSTQNVPVPKHRFGVDPCNSTNERRIGQIPFWHLYEPRESI